jgi:hypothetical protein
VKILLTFLNFNGWHGTSMYFFDLACALKKQGHDVSILSDVRGDEENTLCDLGIKCEKLGIRCFIPTHAPSIKFDVILASHRSVISTIIQKNLYPDSPIISINHSEIISEEWALVDKRIKHYIAIRPAIAKLLEDKYYIDPSQISVIWNPINLERLLSVKKNPCDKMRVVFPATIDYLRKDTLLSLYEKAKDEGFEIVVVGRKYMDYLDDLDPNIISVHAPVWNINRYYANATHTAGIMLGRTSIEGWHFGLPSFVYNVDEFGKIQGMELMQPPEDLSIFDSDRVADLVLDVCEMVIVENKFDGL